MRMRDIIGFALIILSVILGLYVGVWLLFIGGIIQVFSNLDPLNTVEIGWGIVKFLTANIVGYFTFFGLFVTGTSLINS